MEGRKTSMTLKKKVGVAASAAESLDEALHSDSEV
jgi:hypothetical protein